MQAGKPVRCFAFELNNIIQSNQLKIMFGENGQLVGAAIALVIVLGFLLITSGTSPFQAIQSPPGALEAVYPLPTSRAGCEETGGRWQNNSCIHYYTDGGTECKNSGDCEGICLVTRYFWKDEVIVGECAESTIYPTCFAEINYYRKIGTIECQ